MKNNRNFAIGVLTVTALILLVAVLHVYNDKPAYAEASVKSSGYVMCTGAFGQNTDVLYVIDVPTHKMRIYIADRQGNKREITPVTGEIDLEAAFTGK